MLKTNMTKLFLEFICLTVITFPLPSFCEENPSNMVEMSSGQVKLNTTVLLENVTSLNQLLFVSAVVGASQDVEIINKDLQKYKATPFPKLTLNKDVIYVNGESSEVKIISYSPLNLRFHDKYWVYEQNKTQSENYFMLKKFLGSGSNIEKESAFAKLFISEARAGGMGAFVGAVAGFIAAAVIVSFIGSVGLPFLCALFAGSMLVGAIFGSSIGSADPSKENQVLLDRILNSNFDISCNSTSVTVTSVVNKGFGVSYKTQMRIDRKNPPSMTQTSIRHDSFQDDKTTATFSLDQLTSPQRNLVNNLLNCHSEEEAAAIQSKLKEAAAKIKGANEVNPDQNSAKSFK